MISERPAPDAYEEYFKASDQVPRGFKQSVFNSFEEGRQTGSEALNVLQPKLDQDVQSAWDTIEYQKQRESEQTGLGQKALRFLPDMISNTLGMASNPLTLPFVVGGGFLGEGISAVASKVLPQAVRSFARMPLSKFVGTTAEKYLPKSIGELGSVSTTGFSTLGGMAVPEAVIHNYNHDTQSINWGGFTEEVGVNGSIGALLSVPGYAAGVFFKDILGKDESVPMPHTEEAKTMPQRLDEAFKAGKLSKDEYEWGKDFYEDPHKPDLNSRGAQILGIKGHSVNSAKAKVFFEMLSEDDWNNLNSIFPDQLANADTIGDKTALSDFVLGNKLDKLRENPGLVDGLKGYIAESDYKLKGKTKKLTEADAIVESHLHEGVQEKMPFDQKDIYEMAKNTNDAHLPYTVPEIVEKVISHENEIADLKGKVKQLNKLFNKTGKEKYNEKARSAEQRLQELESNKPQLHSPIEELTHIKNKLLTDKGLPKNWQFSKEYERLHDLADVWHNAQLLLDRVNLEADYQKLSAYRSIAKAYVDVLNSNIEKFADTDRVTNYLKQKIDQTLGQSGELKAKSKIQLTPQQALEDANKSPVEPEEQLNQFDEQVKLSDSKSLKNEYDLTKKRYKQFQGAGEKLKSMMNCIGRYQ